MLKSHLIVPTICVGIVAAMVAKTFCEVLSVAEPWKSPLLGAIVATAVLSALASYQRRLEARKSPLTSK